MVFGVHWLFQGFNAALCQRTSSGLEAEIQQHTRGLESTDSRDTNTCLIGRQSMHQGHRILSTIFSFRTATDLKTQHHELGLSEP
jgi:sensor histidine kinase regulating citrate/malate metabolism